MPERLVAIIQARCGSKRLPNKVFKKIAGKPVIERVVNRVKAVNILEHGLIDEIVVATSKNKKDTPIAQWCKKHHIKCHRGQEDDVLARYYHCAIEHKADYILRITADCPVLEPTLVYGLIKTFRTEYRALAFNAGLIPGGHDAELFSFDLLKKIHLGKRTKREREHVSLAMRGTLEDAVDLGGDGFDFSKIKLDLDDKKDLQFIRSYYAYL